jgi:hypothetical protein
MLISLQMNDDFINYTGTDISSLLCKKWRKASLI